MTGTLTTIIIINVHTVQNGKASECIKCGKCEHICPQHLKIRDLLVNVTEEFEKK